MEYFLKSKLLSVPAFIWILQVVYVAAALGLLAVISTKLHKQTHQLPFQVGYVLLMIIVNIAWRIAIKKLKPGWF
jgi:hypothetical protein